MSITVETDMTVRELRAQIARVKDMDNYELYRVRKDAANGYMLYAIKPLPESADRRPNAVAIRKERTRLYRELWLATWDEGMNR